MKSWLTRQNVETVVSKPWLGFNEPTGKTIRKQHLLNVFNGEQRCKMYHDAPPSWVDVVTTTCRLGAVSCLEATDAGSRG